MVGKRRAALQFRAVNVVSKLLRLAEHFHIAAEQDLDICICLIQFPVLGQREIVARAVVSDFAQALQKGGGGKNPNETADNSSDLLVGGDGPDLLLGQGGRDGRTGSTFVAGAPGDDLSVPVPQLQGGDGVDHLHGGDRDDTLHGGAGGGKEKLHGNLNNILYGAAGTDLCSNGPLGGPNPKPNDPYAGTDRGDIRDPSCELPARGQSERVVRRGSSYVFVPFNIVVATQFSWDGF